MKLELIKTKNGNYKLISTSNHKSPALIHIAELLKDANKHSDIKVGVYSIYSSPFSMFKSVHSYISNRTERMTKQVYYKFISGKRQMKAKKSLEQIWKPLDPNKCEELEWSEHDA